MEKPRLLLLSDLFGGNPEWIHYYIEILEPKFDVQYYDILKLARIDSSNEKEIHNQFLSGGIEKAVSNLLDSKKGEVAVLGFSMGGTIAWKASLKGLKTTKLILVSSTRLRFETEKPSCEIKLCFGEKDLNAPKSDWFLGLKISNQIIENEDHCLYQKKDNAFLICTSFL
ncbi:alpha/beta hydrolase [Flavobacterium sp. KACC 22761]|uniref:alpha/beta hydrolase n=1 Tax=Flavobacterium sp. KACC 22761 TaxID=3092665 RepID=UPI002A759A91|nr:alpha/beta hydrolase [Flavobacterium sp. KACC 22761]WPO80571.1 alpha/beta hydrolase [Flavobacterium sp. KACC 22761]